MKYWNKSKKTRERCWTRVQRRVKESTGWNGTVVVYPELQREDEMKLWCQKQSSNGRFYFSAGNPNWYFEDEKDATWFLLKWG